MSDLDIVIVNWNAGNQLLECVLSVQQALSGSMLQPGSCVVVDNASSDGSVESLRGLHPDVKIIASMENNGFGSACNMGAKAGSADNILFLNPDVRLFKESLSIPLHFMETPSYKDVGILGIQLVDAGGIVQPSAGRFPTPYSVLYQMLGLDRAWPARFPPAVMWDWEHGESREIDLVQGAFLLVRRSVFDELKGFDERFFMYYEDVDLAYRARQAGWKSYYLAEAQAFHHGGGVTERIKARRLGYWLISRNRYMAKHFGRLAADGALAATFGLELWVRLLWNIVHGTWQHARDTVSAFAMLASAVPDLLKKT